MGSWQEEGKELKQALRETLRRQERYGPPGEEEIMKLRERCRRDSVSYKQAKKEEKNKPASPAGCGDAERLSCLLKCMLFAHGKCQPCRRRPFPPSPP